MRCIYVYIYILYISTAGPTAARRRPHHRYARWVLSVNWPPGLALPRPQVLSHKTNVRVLEYGVSWVDDPKTLHFERTRFWNMDPWNPHVCKGLSLFWCMLASLVWAPAICYTNLWDRIKKHTQSMHHLTINTSRNNTNHKINSHNMLIHVACVWEDVETYCMEWLFFRVLCFHCLVNVT